MSVFTCRPGPLAYQEGMYLNDLLMPNPENEPKVLRTRDRNNSKAGLASPIFSGRYGKMLVSEVVLNTNYGFELSENSLTSGNCFFLLSGKNFP